MYQLSERNICTGFGAVVSIWGHCLTCKSHVDKNPLPFPEGQESLAAMRPSSQSFKTTNTIRTLLSSTFVRYPKCSFSTLCSLRHDIPTPILCDQSSTLAKRHSSFSVRFATMCETCIALRCKAVLAIDEARGSDRQRVLMTRSVFSWANPDIACSSLCHHTATAIFFGSS